MGHRTAGERLAKGRFLMDYYYSHSIQSHNLFANSSQSFPMNLTLETSWTIVSNCTCGKPDNICIRPTAYKRPIICTHQLIGTNLDKFSSPPLPTECQLPPLIWVLFGIIIFLQVQSTPPPIHSHRSRRFSSSSAVFIVVEQHAPVDGPISLRILVIMVVQTLNSLPSLVKHFLFGQCRRRLTSPSQPSLGHPILKRSILSTTPDTEPRFAKLLFDGNRSIWHDRNKYKFKIINHP